MAYPVVLSRTPSNDTSGTSHSVSLGTISEGDLYVVLFVQDWVSSEGTESFPAGWTTLSTNNTAGLVRLTMRYRVAVAGDPSSITVTTGGSQATISRVWRIQAGTFTGNPESVANAVGSGASPSASPDPPSLTPSWGAVDALWLVVNGNDGARSTTGFDANLTQTGSATSSNTANGVGIGYGEREAAISSYDPTAFTISASDDWLAQTAAIQGVTAAFIADPPLLVTPQSNQRASFW